MVRLVYVKTPFGKIPIVKQTSKEKIKIWVKLKDLDKEMKKWIRRN